MKKEIDPDFIMLLWVLVTVVWFGFADLSAEEINSKTPPFVEIIK